MKVGVIHFNIEAFGGAELVCLKIAEALQKNGIKVTLCDLNQLDYAKTLNVLNVNLEDIDHFLNLKQTRLPFLQTYQRISHGYFSIKKLCKVFSPDYVFFTYYPPPLIPKEHLDKAILYIHYPSTGTDPNEKNFVLTNQQSKSFFRRIYWKPYNFLLNNMDNYKNAKLIANSKYTAGLIEKYWGRKAPVIYPPCPLYLDLPLNKKNNWVCSIGRISPEKRHNLTLEIAKKLPNIEFHIIGTTVSKKMEYAKKLIGQAKDLPNVHFHMNCSFKEKLRILRNSKVLLHCKTEEFGIVFVEAMSSGVIPVCPNSGAPKVDGFVPPEFRWENCDQAIKIIEKCMDLWTVDLAEDLRMKSIDFGVEKFQENILNYVHSLT